MLSRGKLYAHTGYFNPPAQVERTETGYHIWTKDFPKMESSNCMPIVPMTEALRRDQANEINKGNGKEISQKREIH